MKEKKFAIGQVVKHRSNPTIELTVERYLDGEEKLVQCSWIFNGELKRDTFPEDTLTEDKANSSTP